MRMIGSSMPGSSPPARMAAVALMVVSLAGCASWFEGSSVLSGEGKAAPAPKPVYAVGDSYQFEDNGNAVREQVMGFSGSRVIWFNDRGMSWTANPDVVSPPLAWSADVRLGPGSQHLFGDPGRLFPLEPGKSVKFLVAGSSEALPDGWQAENECRVKSNEETTVKAGSFNAFRIDCHRGEVTETLFYAPAVQNYVLRLRAHGEGEPDERKELVGFQYAAIPERSQTPQSAAQSMPAGQRAMATPMAAPPQSAETPAAGAIPSELLARISRLEDAVQRLEKQIAMAPAAAPPPAAGRGPQRVTKARGEPAQTAGTEAAPAAKESKPAAASAGERYGVHLASYRSVAVAQQGWSKLSRQYPELLGQADHRTTEFDPGDGRGVFIRLVAGPYSDRAEAARLCHELQAKQLYCHVVSLGPA